MAEQVQRAVALSLTLLAALFLASCAPAAPSGEDPSGDASTIDLEGRIREIAAGDGASGWTIQTDQGLLPLELPDGAPPVRATCVTITVPADFGQPTDPAELFDSLEALVQATGAALPVAAYC